MNAVKENVFSSEAEEGEIMTKGDWIRSMTNNQLSDKLGCECCIYIDRNTGRCKAEYEQSQCHEGILKWLNKTHRRQKNEIMAER